MKTFPPLFIIALFCCFKWTSLLAQCPQSTVEGIHILQTGENLYRIAIKYSVSLADLYAWNNIQNGEKLVLCRELFVAPPSSIGIPRGENEAKAPKAKPTPLYTKQLGGKHVVNKGETVEGIAKIYGYTPERFREFNAITTNTQVPAGTVLLSSDCPCQTISAPSPQPNPAPVIDKSSPVSPQPELAISMTQEELDMVKEINLMRSSPADYVVFVQEFINDLNKNGSYGNAIATAKELMSILKRTAPLSQLEPLECLYNSAKKHAEDQKPKGDIDHQGSDGSWPWDRVLAACPSLTDGNENIIGGPAVIRRAVLVLLVDDGIESRGHRKNLLDPEWKYIACYKIGQVGAMPNFWLQEFAK